MLTPPPHAPAPLPQPVRHPLLRAAAQAAEAADLDATLARARQEDAEAAAAAAAHRSEMRAFRASLATQHRAAAADQSADDARLAAEADAVWGARQAGWDAAAARRAALASDAAASQRAAMAEGAVAARAAREAARAEVPGWPWREGTPAATGGGRADEAARRRRDENAAVVAAKAAAKAHAAAVSCGAHSRWRGSDVVHLRRCLRTACRPALARSRTHVRRHGDSCWHPPLSPPGMQLAASEPDYPPDPAADAIQAAALAVPGGVLSVLGAGGSVRRAGLGPVAAAAAAAAPPAQPPATAPRRRAHDTRSSVVLG